MRQLLKLFEAPLADFGAFGDLSTPGSLRADDLRAIQNQKWIDRLHKLFNQTPFKYNIYLYNAREGKIHFSNRTASPVDAMNIQNLQRYAGIMPIHEIERLIGKKVPDPSGITILLVENEGDERIALTPWMVAHRISHAIFASINYNHYNFNIKRGCDGLYNLIHSMLSQVLSIVRRFAEKHPESPYEVFRGPRNLDREDIEVAKLIGTTRISRTGSLIRIGEFYVDTLTQFILQNQVTFNHPVLDAHKEYDPSIDRNLLLIYQKHHYDKEDFVKHATADEQAKLRKQFGAYRRTPRIHYTAFDKDGTAIAAFGEDSLSRYQDKYRIEKHVPSKAELARWQNYRNRVEKLEVRKQQLSNIFDDFEKQELWQTSDTENLDKILDKYVAQINAKCTEVIQACIGQAFVF